MDTGNGMSDGELNGGEPTETPAARRERRHPKHWLRRAGAAISLLLVLAVASAAGTAWWLATRPEGLQRAIAWADGLGGVQLQATGAQGPLAGPFRVERLQITHERVTVIVEHLHGELRLGALLYGTIGIQELQAGRVVVVPHASREPAADAGFLPAWLRLAWDRVQVDQLEVAASDSKLLLKDVHAAGSLNRWTLRTEPLAARWQGWSVRGKAQLAAGHPMALQWQGQIHGPVLGEGPNWQWTGSLAGDIPTNAKSSRWQFTARTSQPAGLTAQGELQLMPDGWRVTGDCTAKVLDLAPWGLGASGPLTAALKGSVSSNGAQGDVNLQLSGTVGAAAIAAAGLKPLQLQLDAGGSRTRWQIRSAQLAEPGWGRMAFMGAVETATDAAVPQQTTRTAVLQGDWSLPGKGHVALNATAGWPSRGPPRWRIRAQGQHLEPSPQFPARLGAPATRLGQPPPPFALQVDVGGTGFASPATPGGMPWEIHAATVESLGSSLELRGQWGGAGRLDGRLQTPDLSRWSPEHTGSLNAKFQLDGASAAKGDFNLTVEARHLAHPAWPARADTLTLGLAGRWRHGTLEGRLTALSIEPGGPWQSLGTVRLQQPATWRAASGTLSWDELCLQSPGQAGLGTLCTQGQWATRAPWEVQASWRSLDLAHWLRTQAPPLPQAAGTLQGELRGIASATLTFGATSAEAAANPSAVGGITHGQLDVELAQGEVHWQRDRDEGRLPMGRATAQARWLPRESTAPARVELDIRAAAKPGLQLQATATVRPTPAVSWQQWPLVGAVSGTLPALDFLPALFEDLDRVAGEVTARGQLAGTLGAPDYRGQLQLRGGELDVVPVNLRLRQVQATVTLAPGELQLEGSARAGSGELATQGRLTFGGAGAMTGEIRVSGERLLLVDVPEARVVAAPDLRFTLQHSALQVAGTVQIPSARFAPQDLTNVVLPSADERIAGEQRSTVGALPIDTRVQLVLGKDVSLDTLGLTGKLAGTLNAHAPPTGTATAAGELSITGGKFKAYTRELDVEKGRLLFTGGPLADPGLDLRASKTFPGVKAGVLVRGTLRRPLVRFFSDPARTQNEIASLLVVGRSLEGLQGTGGASSLNGNLARDTALQQGGALLAAQVGQYVGLDEVQLERDQNDAAALVLGKYLSPRLYVSYGVGLANALNALKLRYTLGNRWVIKTEAGSRQSLDLEYTTEH